MSSKLKVPIFVQILLATLLPLILIFSLVLATITGSVFRSSADTAREKTHFFAQRSAEQVRDNFLQVAALSKLAAQSLAYTTCEPSQARALARQIARCTLENSSSAYRIRIYFEPGENAFGTGEAFAHVYYNDGNSITGYPLALSEERNPDVASAWYDQPLQNGAPYHNSDSPSRFGQDKRPVYVASASYPVWRNGEMIGSVGMSMLYRKSFQLVDKWGNDGSYRMLIVSEYGTILYASNEELIDRNLDSLGFDEPFLANMQNAMRYNESFMAESHSPVLGQKSLICLYPVNLPVEATRVFVYMDTPTELVYSEARASVRTVFLTFTGGLLLFTGSLFAVTRNITTPIKKLIATADLIAHGQLDAARHGFGGTHNVRHELDSLENSLNVMFKEMEESHNLKIAAVKTEYEKKKLEETSAAKDRFFANISHEIRTPMNVILGMSEMMLRETPVEEQKKYAQHIRLSAESLLKIINDILDLSRLEAGELPLVPVHYDFKLLMENICSLGRYLAEEKGLVLNCETTGPTPDVLYGDDGRLRQVLLNLIGNAVKFTAQGSITLRVKDEGGTLSFEVADTGVGIKPEEMQYLFAPFKQLDRRNNRSIEGAGLGLSICRNLLELMGGEISAESEYGKGSTFRAVIPKVPGNAGKIEPQPGTLPASFDSKARVLVVDDSESNLKVAVEFLRGFGLAVDAAASGAQCLSMAAETNYDLIFMDHMMPEIDGIETVKRLRALGGRFAEVPVVALTANAVSGSHELFLAAGMNDFLAKPIELAKLRAILAKWAPAKATRQENGSVSGAPKVADAGQAAGATAEPPGKIGNAAKPRELDIRQGLDRMAGNLELYEEMLALVADAIPAALKKMDAAVLADDMATLSNEAHKLKSELANLGAAELSDKLKELELASADRPRFTQKLASLRPALEEFADMLRTLPPEKNNPETQDAPEEWENFEDKLRELREALTGFDYEKSRKIISGLIRFQWGGERNKHLEAINAQIKLFNYEAALNDLNRFFPKLR